ncbi:MAG: biopolymer transporter ExbD [Bdellovibrionaceae bacterium]|nr:biopolymer transporter ExbD [Pseudobdellovibrionaceae bacterium]
MAQFQEMNPSSGRKSNVDLNLVPFIDLMSVCIIFLLITAVWTQVSMIQLGSSIYSKKTTDDIIEPPPFSELILRVDVLQEGFRILLGKDFISVPKLSDENYDKDKLIAILKKAKEQYPEKMDGVASVRDQVYYKHLIEAMDALLIAGFPQVSITTTGVQ